MRAASRLSVETLLPPIRDRATGGNLFNRQVLELLAGDGRIALGKGLSPSPEAAAEGVLLVDSLEFTSSRNAWLDSPSRKVLLAHYLHLLDSENGKPQQAARERELLPLLDGAVTTSRYCRYRLIEEGMSAERVLAVTPGLASAFRRPRTEVSAPSSAPGLLTVANLVPGKGLMGLLSVLESLADIPWHWQVAGDSELAPEYVDSLRRRLGVSAIAARTTLLGTVDRERLIRLYDSSTAMVLPSRFETCSMATMEAMARGLPVSAHAVGGLTELLGDSAARQLAPPGDLDALRDRLRRLLTTPAVAAEDGRVNLETSKSFPTWQDCASELHRFLVRLARKEG